MMYQQLENWSIDGDYIYKNFRSNTRIRVINESTLKDVFLIYESSVGLNKNENIQNFNSKKNIFYNNSFISKTLKSSFFRI